MSVNNVLPDDLMNSVLGKLYELLTSGDDVVPKSEDNYISWMPVGVPFDPEDLDFLSEGFGGIYRKPKGEGEDGPSAQELMAQDSLRKYQQAENLARLCDMIPDTSGVSGDIIINAFNAENTLSQAYDQILKFSQVADFEVPEKTKAKIERLRGLLKVKTTKKNIVTEEEEEIIEDSPLVKAYNEKMQNYLSAALEYNTRRIEALAAKDPQAVHFWSINSSILRNKVQAAKSDWISNGFKEEYEQIAAFIAQVQGRSMALLKAEYLDDLEKSRITGVASGSDFQYTSLIPGGFAKSDQGWTEFKFASSDFESKYKHSKRTSGGSAGGFFGINFGGSAKKSKEKITSKVDSKRFSLKFKMCVVPINRDGWFNPNFLTSEYWRFDQGNLAFKSNQVSDGKQPPNGMIPAYTTAAIFVKDLKLQFSESNSVMESITRGGSASAAVQWGPFYLGGSHKGSSTEKEHKVKTNSQGIEIDGMQLIGFKCHMLPLSPNPNPKIENWI